MKLSTICLTAVSLTALLMSCKSAPTGAAVAMEGEMAPPKPGPEHALLADGVGTWDATVTMFSPEGAQTSKAVATRRMTGGGLWLVEDFTGEMMGDTFTGHGVTGFDPQKGKYVGVWVDSMVTSVMASEGTYDTGTRRFTSEAMMPMGNTSAPVTMVSESIDADTQRFSMWMAGEGGKKMETMRIDYKRRK